MRAYARQVGLDAEKVVAEYQALTAPELAADKLAGGGGKPEQRAKSKEQRRAALGAETGGRVPGGRRNRGGGWVAVVIAVVVIAGIVYWGQKPQGRGRRAEVRGHGESQELRAKSNGRSAEGQTRATASGGQAARTGEVGVAAPQAAGTNGHLAAPVTVGLAATAPAWIHLSAAGKTIVEMTLPAGESVSYRVSPPLALVTGNAGATQVTVNGVAQPALGAAGGVVLWRYPPGTATAVPAAAPAKGTGGPATGEPPAGVTATPKTGTGGGGGRTGKSASGAAGPKAPNGSTPAIPHGGREPASPGGGLKPALPGA